MDAAPFVPYYLPKPLTVGDFEFEIVEPQENDVIQLKSSKWRNSPQDNLVDGGNF